MTLPQDVQDEVDAFIRADRTIHAIKAVRDTSGLRLREAKEFVEARAVELRAR